MGNPQGNSSKNGKLQKNSDQTRSRQTWGWSEIWFYWIRDCSVSEDKKTQGWNWEISPETLESLALSSVIWEEACVWIWGWYTGITDVQGGLVTGTSPSQGAGMCVTPGPNIKPREAFPAYTGQVLGKVSEKLLRVKHLYFIYQGNTFLVRMVLLTAGWCSRCPCSCEHSWRWRWCQLCLWITTLKRRSSSRLRKERNQFQHGPSVHVLQQSRILLPIRKFINGGYWAVP